MTFEDEYESRLIARCEKFKERWPDKDVAIRVIVLRQLGFKTPPISKIGEMVYERAVRESIRSVMNWPSADEYQAGVRNA